MLALHSWLTMMDDDRWWWGWGITVCSSVRVAKIFSNERSQHQLRQTCATSVKPERCWFTRQRSGSNCHSGIDINLAPGRFAWILGVTMVEGLIFMIPPWAQFSLLVCGGGCSARCCRFAHLKIFSFFGVKICTTTTVRPVNGLRFKC